eukprot:TRINITY_DN10106_c0_g1_i11.p1 TRINITY_DN10106_c0_g1~~TRINITY_DN10106_c0_g1_i11.p1  ORF type:complete len:288 (-),score=27.03 TRINITY_DN10106_c0_g1_i11:130-993(-)
MQRITAVGKCEPLTSTSFPLPSPNQNPPLCPRGHDKCHCCEKLQKPAKLVKCQNTHCGLYFCRSFLVRRYKFSKKAVKRLPGSTWQCPKCTKQCYCDKCIPESERQLLNPRLKHNIGTGFKRELKDLVAMKDKMVSYGNNVVMESKPKSIKPRKKNVNHKNPEVLKKRPKDVRGVEEVKEYCVRTENADTKQIKLPPSIVVDNLLLIPCTPLSANFYIKLINPGFSSNCKQPFLLITFRGIEDNGFWQYGNDYLGGAAGSFAWQQELNQKLYCLIYFLYYSFQGIAS